MTDNEIIKALECCKNSNCLNCPFNISKEENQVSRVKNCVATMKTLSFDLINRLQAENEGLRETNEKLVLGFDGFNKMLKNAKSEAIKEFAERLKEKADELKQVCLDGKWAISQYDVDKLLKEMVGEGK